MMRSISSLVAFLFLIPSATAQSTPDGDLMESRAGFSRSIVVHDGSVYVGEPANDLRPGTVYVYGRSVTGEWVETSRVTSGDSFMGDGFGAAMAAFGDLMAVTATDQDDGRGAVYVFDVADGGAQEIARLSPTDTSLVAGFGTSVAMGDGVLVVGAMNVDDEAGAAYVFERDANDAWTQTARLFAEDVEAGHLFGSSTAMHGGDILIGAPGTNRSAGAVYIFAKEDGAWTEIDSISERDLERGDGFGGVITIAEGHAFIAAPYTDRHVGRVYVYEKADDGDWDDAGRMLPFDAQSNLRFGSAIGVTGTAVWIGAPGADGFRGAVYAALRNNDGGYTGVEKIRAAEPAPGSQFAGSIAVSGDVAAVGTPGLNSGAGGVVIFEFAGGAWTAAASFEPARDALDSVTGAETFCEDGTAGLFECEQMDMLSFLSVRDIGAEPNIRVNDVWGWTDPETGREIAIVGRNDGTSFLDVTDPLNPVYLGSLDKTEGSNTSSWRDMKVYSDHVYIVADGAGDHGVQVFDLTRLRDVQDPPADFEADARYDNISSAHNIVINEKSGYAYVVGASSGGETCGGGLHMINLQDPKSPQFAGCFADAETGLAGTGYSHDAMCIEYNGPDQEHVGEEICFGANETAISIANVSDKESPVKVSSASYPSVGYSHQGWITEDHRYFYSNDELDELQGKASQTRTLVWDVTDLDDPQLVKEYMAPTKSSDHNLYIKGNTMYQSNYVAGLRVLDISDPENPVEIGHFDTVPYGSDDPGFNGSFSNYPYFESGTIVVTSGREGVFLLKKREVDI